MMTYIVQLADCEFLLPGNATSTDRANAEQFNSLEDAKDGLEAFRTKWGIREHAEIIPYPRMLDGFGDVIEIAEQTPKSSALDTQVGGSHYKDMKIQPIEYCLANNLNACESAVVKYISRHREKNGKQDLEKIKHYVDILIEFEYGD